MELNIRPSADLRNKYNEDLPYYKIGKDLPIGNMTSQFLPYSIYIN